ncbi:MAG: tyrosine-type recombinase/integrase [Clostridia bacterium]|nr:tyrosine-type recombinase/integrase [Clostridia bacterium]
MPRKSNTKREDGRYLVRVYIGIVDGKKKYKSVYGNTQKEANQKADEVRASLRKGMDLSSSNDSFVVWADYWLTYKKNEVSVDRYNALVPRVQVWKDALSFAKISQIKPFDLQTILFSISAKNPLTGKPMAKKTIRSYIQIVTSIFDFAIDNRIIDYNPASKLKAPQGASEKHRRALTKEERQWVMEFEHRAKPSAMLMMLSGLRRGEATALQWNDIDFEKNTITVTKSYNFKQGEFKKPKNNKSRVVTVPQVLIDYLASLPKTSPFVLTSANGLMMTDTAWKRMYDSYMKDLNLQYGNFVTVPNKFAPTKTPMMVKTFTPHELRHTFCTIMYEAGVDVLTAKEQMGHSDVKTTLAIYTHLSALHKEKDLQKLDAFLSKCESKVSQENR